MTDFRKEFLNPSPEFWSTSFDAKDPKPLWVLVPEVDNQYSMAWRMGRTSMEADAFEAWFKGLDTSEQASFRVIYPEPDGWNGYYDRIITRQRT